MKVYFQTSIQEMSSSYSKRLWDSLSSRTSTFMSGDSTFKCRFCLEDMFETLCLACDMTENDVDSITVELDESSDEEHEIRCLGTRYRRGTVLVCIIMFFFIILHFRARLVFHVLSKLKWKMNQ